MVALDPWGQKPIFYPSKNPLNYTIYFKKSFLSKVKNRFNQDNYSKTYNQISFILYVILWKIFIYFTLFSAGHNPWIMTSNYYWGVYAQQLSSLTGIWLG